MKNNQELKFSFWFSLASLLSLSFSLSTSCILRDVDFDSLLSPLKLLNGWTFKKLTHTFDFIRHNKATIFIIYTLTAKKYVKMNKTLQRKFLATHLGLSLNSRICIVASVNFKARWLNPIYFRYQGMIILIILFFTGWKRERHYCVTLTLAKLKEDRVDLTLIEPL